MSRPVGFVTGAVGATVGAVGGALPALWGVVRGASGSRKARQPEREREQGDALQWRRAIWRGPGGASSGGAGASGAGVGGVVGSPQASRARAVPVSTTVVQDGVKWVNLVRFVNLARLFTPCFRPSRGPRRRVRFGGAASGRGLLGGSTGGADAGKAAADLATSAGGASPGPAGTIRPIYIQVRQARQLVWPTYEGVEATCYCLLLVDDNPRGTTQALPVGAPGGGGGGAGGGGGTGGGNNTVVWNEVFSFPRALLESRGAGGRVCLQVWSIEAYGEDVLVGQAELDLGPMLAAERPHPLSALLELQAIDEDTGQVEPGSCGELSVAAWVEPGAEAPRCAPCALASSLPPSDLDEAGVVTSNLSAPCGSKSMPAVVHSPLGTLYEEPCVVVLKITVTGLADLNWELLSSTAQQGGITKRRVRLEGALRNVASGRVCAGWGGKEGAGGGSARLGAEAAGLGAVAEAAGANGNAAVVRAATSLSPAPSTKRSLRRLLTGAWLQRQSSSKYGFGAGVTALSPGPRSPLPTAANGRTSASPDAKSGFPGLASFRRATHFRRTTSGGGALSTGGAGDDLIEEEDEPPGGGSGGAGGGGGALGGGAAAGGMASVLGDTEMDDGSSLALHPTAPLSGITSEDAAAAAAAAGAGMFCYFKVSVDKHSDKSRLRWLPTGQPPPPAGSSPCQPPPPPPPACLVALQPSVFVFALARPLPNAPVGLTLYVTSSARRRGRAVGRLMVPLYDLLDHVLGSAAAAAAGAGGAGGGGFRRDGGVSGKPVEIKLPFEDQELGSVAATVQLADMDERAMLFRVPLVADPQQLVTADGQYGYGQHYGPHGYGYDGAGGAYGPSIVPVEGGGYLQGPEGGVGGGGSFASARALGPVLADTQLLRRVLKKSGVEGDVEDWFVRSYARAGSLKVAGGGGLQEALAEAMQQAYYGGGRSSGAGGGIATDLLRLSDSGSVSSDPFRRFARSTSAEGGENGGGGGPFGPMGHSRDPPGASGSLSADSSGGSGGAAGGSGGRPMAPTAAAAAPGRTGPSVSGPKMLGSVALRITSINSSGALSGGSCCCIVKCGPHWLRTADRTPGEGAGALPQWQVIIPLYNPSTVLTVGIFVNSGRSVMGLTFSDSLTLVSRVRFKLSAVRPFRRHWHVIAMYMKGSSGSAGTGGGAPPLVGVLGVKLSYCGLGSLAAAYLAPPAPESLYELGLDGDAGLKAEADARKIAESWLASAQPPIPPEVAKLLLDDGRSAFDFTRTKRNWRRVKSGMRLVSSLAAWLRHICSWRCRRDSGEVVLCIALLCYLPSTACKLFLIMTALAGIRRYLDARSRLAAQLAQIGAAGAGGTAPSDAPAAATLLSPSVGGAAAASAAAATAAAAAAAAAAVAPGGAAREPVGTIGDVTIGGGVVDEGSDDEVGEDAKVPVGTVAEFKRKFAELIELGLMLQNLFDDVASLLERLQALLSFSDAVASWLFIGGCLLGAAVLALLGFQTALFLGLLWQVRPPVLRDALPPPPLNYFLRLPCKSAAEFG